MFSPFLFDRLKVRLAGLINYGIKTGNFFQYQKVENSIE
jgi:hypothetical protein